MKNILDSGEEILHWQGNKHISIHTITQRKRSCIIGWGTMHLTLAICPSLPQGHIVSVVSVMDFIYCE